MTPSAQDVEIFFAALNLGDPAERTAYLDRACADSPALRAWIEGELRRQLAPDASTDRPVGPTTVEAGTGAESPPPGPDAGSFGDGFRSEAAGETIGAYTLLQRLGEGGFGTVWMAEQSQPVRRQVALKIVRVGANSRETLARFAQERQALALMDHPNIARVFDAGATPNGRPFFVMELVRGATITEYCDGFRLSVGKRLALFIEVCHAVQHAHQKGILHRDLKPSNVLVARREDDGAAVPKVIDFGIAKALASGPLTEMTLATMAGGMLGTPLYMSPEQAASALDVDTRSDVYSLGVLLHQLLVGCTPLDAKSLEACRSYEEMRRLVLDAEPRRLTVRWRELPAEAAEAAARERGSDPRELARTLRGDLEWIVLRALEKDRDRRYASAQEFAADLGRCLADEPVVARPPSAGYRLNKLWRRNRATLTAAGAVAAAVLVGSGVSVQQAVRARAAETRARTSQVEEATQRRLAEIGQDAARQSECVADVGLAQQSLRGNNLARAVALLDRHRPGGAAWPDAGSGGAEEDPRGFAWRYLWGLCRGEDGGAFADVNSPTNAVTFSPDGRLLAVASLTGVTICDARTRAVVTRLAAPNVRSLRFLRDGQTLVTQSGIAVRLWRTADWTEAGAWTEGRGALALSADGARLALAGPDGVVVRDVATWRETARVPGASAPMAFSPDGRTLAAAGAGGSVSLWPLLPEGTGGNRTAPRVLADSAGAFAPGQIAYFEANQGLIFAADGAALFVVENELSERGTFLVSTWDVRSGRRTATMPDDPARPEHTGFITSFAASPDGRLLATASFDHTVRLWDVARRRCVATFQGHRAEVGGVTFSPDGQTLASCDRLGQVRTWSARPERTEPVVREAVVPLAFADGGRTLVALTPRGTVAGFDVDTRQPRPGAREIVLEPVALAPVAASGDGRTVAQGLPDGRVRVWRDGDEPGAPPRLVPALPGGRPVETLALTPDGNTLIAGTRGEPWQAVNLRTGAARTLPFGGGRVVLSEDGRRLLALPAVPTAAVNGAPLPDMGLAALPGSGPPEMFANVPGRGAEDAAVVVVWDLATGKALSRLPVAPASVFDAALSPDGARVATVGSDGIIRLWDAATGAAGISCSGHKQLVHRVEFAHDGKTLASSSDDGTLRIWNVPTGQELISIRHLGGRMTDLRFSPDDGTLAVSRVNGGQPLGTFLHRAPSFAETDR